MEEKIRVLLVEENESDFLATRSLLESSERATFDIIRASTFAEASEAILADEHDVCLLEFGLGGEHGVELIQSAKHMGCQAPVIVLTGMQDRELDTRALKAGATDFLIKGEVEAAALARMIRFAIERRRELNSLRASERRYAVAISGSDAGLWDWDMLTGVVHYTRRWFSLLGLDEGETSNKPGEWFDRIHPDDARAVSQAMSAHFDGMSSHFKSEHRILHADGDYRWMQVHGRSVRDERGCIARFAGSMSDVSSRKRAEQHLREEATRDSLTGLYNRRYFLERLASEMAAARRHEYPLTLCICDIDHFKSVNDSHGHNAGDDVLSTFGRLLADSVRLEDIPARFGGDEFCVIMPHTEGRAAVHAIERLRKRVQEIVFAGGEGYSVSITATFGLVEMHDGHHEMRDLIEAGDQALYQAKRHGRNRTAIAAAK